MGVDHGLGGRDNAKSREKRAKRLAKKAAKAKFEAKSTTKGKKREVVFNEESRVNYLTGFRQRKKERRQYGLAMQVIKDQKAAKANKIKLHNLTDEEAEQRDDCSMNSVPEREEEDTTKMALFSDDLTTSMFGGEVEVAIDDAMADRIDEASGVSVGRVPTSGRKGKSELSQMDRAMKKAKHIMHVRAVNKRNRVKHPVDEGGGGEGRGRGGRGGRGKGGRAVTPSPGRGRGRRQ